MSGKSYQVGILGATGFTGRLVCKYIQQNYPELKWCIIGRNVNKLEKVKQDLNLQVPTIYGDVTMPDTLDNVTSKCEVLLSTAGPFALYGTQVVKSCIKNKTNYVDITGEPQWVRSIIDEFHDEAKENKVKIVNCCGFDCIPSDLGCQLIVEEMFKRSLIPKEVNLIAKAEGGVSGGTIASMLNVMEQPNSILLEMSNPFYLNPRIGQKFESPTDPLVLSQASDCFSMGYDKFSKSYTIGYVMQSIDTRIVNRSNALLNFKYGKNFIYKEKLAVPNAIIALIATLFMPMVMLSLYLPFTRSIIKLLVPKQGQGPSEKVMNSGYFSMQLWGVGTRHLPDGSSKDEIVTGSLSAFNGDPGYKQTAKFIVESALCFIFDSDSITSNYGVLTPSTAFGSAIKKRLQAKDVNFTINE